MEGVEVVWCFKFGELETMDLKAMMEKLENEEEEDEKVMRKLEVFLR